MTNSTDPITVMIVDDHEMVRRGACSYLEAQLDISVVAQAGSGEEAVKLALASGRGAGPRLSTLTLALALAVLGGCAASPQQDTASAQLAKELDKVVGDVPGPIHYFAKQVDLKGEGRTEYVVHVAGPMVCGSGGCDTFVFAQEGSGLRLVSRTSVTRPPIVVASTTTQGWRDLVVRVSGGRIIPGYDARLQFDGRTYPANPTVPPAEPLKAPASGEVAIPTFESFTEGRLLRAGAK